MELQKGICILCCNTKVIKPSQSQKAYKIITLLLPKEILNPIEFDKIQSHVRFCPVCYHKLVIIKHTNKNVEAAKSATTAISNEISNNSCHLCHSLKNLFQITSWPYFNAISEGYFPKDTKCLICSDCFFYLEIKNKLKTKLLSQYPQLGAQQLNNNENKRKWKVKFTPNVRLQSTPVSDRKKEKFTKKRKFAEMNNSSSSAEDSLAEKNINFGSLKKFQPLKTEKSFRNNNLISSDSKFLNQIPYVLVSSSDLSNVYNYMSNEKCDAKEWLNEASEENNEKNDTTLNTTGKLKGTHDFKKHLVVNVIRMNIEKHFKKYDLESDVHNSIELEASQSPNEMEEDIFTDTGRYGSTKTQDNNVEEPETSFEIKNKRKSVSFAEEKNVEIEYFEDVSNIKFGHVGLEDDSAEAVVKQSRGILKRDENTGLNIEEQAEEKSKDLGTNGETIDISDDEEQAKGTDQTRGEQLKTGAVTNKIRSRRNTQCVVETISDDENSSDTDDENLLELVRKSKTQSAVIDNDVQVEGTDKTNVEDISDDDTNPVTDKNDEPKVGNNSDAASVDNEAIPEENNIPDHFVDEEDLKNNGDAKVKPKSVSKKKKTGIDVSKTETEDVSDSDGSKDDENLDKSAVEESIEDRKHEKAKLKTRKKKSSDEEERDEEESEEQVNSHDSNGKSKEIESDKDAGDNSNVYSCTDNDQEVSCKDSGGTFNTPLDDEGQVNSSKSCSKNDGKIITQNTKTSENSEETPNEDEEAGDDESTKKSTIPENEVLHLVDKYLNTEDDLKNTQKKDTALNKTTNDNEKCDVSKKDCVPTSSFTDFDKDEELGLSEDDNENINSILSHIFSPEIPDEEMLLETKSECNIDNVSGDDVNHGVKRKTCDDELNLSKEKKKKKVTFCEDVT